MGYQLNTDFSTIAPSEGGQRPSFPPSDSKGWLCMMVESEPKENSAKNGQILVVKLQGMEGPVTGKIHEFSINLANPNAEAVRIGQQELSAIAHCVGHIRVGNTSELHNRPFRAVVALDKDQDKYPGSTRIMMFRDQNGNKPSEAGQGALTNSNAAAFQQGQPTQGQNPATFQQQQPQGQNGGGWGGGAPQGNGAGNPGQGQPAMGQPGQGGGFGDPNQGGGFQGQPQGQNFQGQPQQGFDPNAGQTQAFQPGQFNPNTQQQPQQGQNPNGGGFQQQGGTGQPNWA